jgi:hypothetical protein
MDKPKVKNKYSKNKANNEKSKTSIWIVIGDFIYNILKTILS